MLISDIVLKSLILSRLGAMKILLCGLTAGIHIYIYIHIHNNHMGGSSAESEVGQH